MNLPCKPQIIFFSIITLNVLVILKTTYVSAHIESGETACLSALLADSIVELSRFITAARSLDGIEHRNALMELFLELRENEIKDLITTRDINIIPLNHNNQKIKAIIANYYVQKNNDVLNMDDESINRIYESLYDEITREEVEEVFRALNIMPSDSNADETYHKHHLNRILEEIRTAKKRRRNIFNQPMQPRIIGRIHISKPVIKKINALKKERIKSNLQNFIEDMNNNSLSFDYLHRKWKHSKLKDTNIYHAHIAEGYPTYVVCYTVENNIINLFFFGTHEKTDRKFKICKRKA